MFQLNARGKRLDKPSPKGRHGNPKYFENSPKWARNGPEDPRKMGAKMGPVFNPKISGFGAVDDVGKRPISLWHKQTPGILGVDFYPDRLYNIL